VRKSAMMGKTLDRASKVMKHVEVRDFGGHSHGHSSQRRSAIESSATQASTGQKMSDGFQAFSLFVVAALYKRRWQSVGSSE
jgi:hypothetical protein